MARRTSGVRQRADARGRLGASGEEAACRLLRRAGYRVLERNYRSRYGELDAVARQGGELVFVEVRTRSSDELGSGAESVGPAKQRQLVRMARAYLQDKELEELPCRFDVVEMAPRGEGRWEGRIIRDAFQAR